MNFVALPAENRMSIENEVLSLPVKNWLEPNIQILTWFGDEGRGRIEYNDRSRLFEKIGFGNYFNQPMLATYMPLIGAWMEAIASELTLDQAKQLKSEVVEALYNNKRIQPFQYPANTGHWYDATDKSLIYMIALRTTGSTSEVNTLVDRVNANIITHFNGSTTPNIRGFQTAYNGAVGQLYRSSQTLTDTGTTVAQPGLTTGNISSFTFTDMTAIAAVAAGVGGTPIPWVPLNATAQVNIPAADFSAALQGILTRRRTLDGVMIGKKNLINAATTIANVLAVDVLSLW